MFSDIAHFVHLNHAHHLVSLYSFTEDDTSGNVFDSDNYQRDNTIKGTEWPGQQGHIAPDLDGVANFDLGYTSIDNTKEFVTSYCPFDGQDADSNHWCSSFTTVDDSPFYGKGI
mmetsp:Transcript_30568/g.63932  ORF Transcript_30568/g.63932 Transcript_30568/m.63932 type:complete len:114 (-) Transcript_30568:284-625(-)